VRYTETRLAGKDNATPSLAANVPRVGNVSAVLAGVPTDTTAAAEAGVLLSVDACPGASAQAIGHVADSLFTRAGYRLGAPVAGREFVINVLVISALVVVAVTPRRSGRAWRCGTVAPLIVRVPASVWAMRIRWLGVLGHAASVGVVPLPISGTVLVTRR